MAPTAIRSLDDPALPEPHAMLARAAILEYRLADAVRSMLADSPGTATSGTTLPLAMADAATVLWTRFHKFVAADPAWPDRDRFVLSAGHGAPLLYALLHLTGHAVFDRGPMPPGLPEFGAHPAIEASTGPLGQGLATAVGMALAERLLAARFGRSLVDHRTWVVACRGDLMEGITHEAASLAGQLRLEKLTVIWHDDGAGVSGEDQLKRFAACGWAVKQVDGGEATQIASAFSMAMRSKKPTLVACRCDPEPAASYGPIAEAVAGAWQRVGMRGATARRGWLKRLAHHPLRAEFERAMAGRLPDACYEALGQLKAELSESRPTLAALAASRRVLDALIPALPELIGGAADLLRDEMAAPAVAAGSFAGRHVQYGLREHGMAAAMNGMALHGGIIPSAAASFAFIDYMRPALRLAAIMRQRVIHLLTDAGAAGGPTQQSVEQLAGLRAMPNAYVFRPADAIETVECWELALRRTDGPSLIALGEAAFPPARVDAAESRCARGGYVIAEANGPRQATLIASGAEVHLALAAREALAAEGISVAVVSLPCWELFALQDDGYRAHVLGAGLRIAVEAANGFGWERWLGPDGVFIGLQGFGDYAPGASGGAFGVTAAAVADVVRKRQAERADQERMKNDR